jgi:hypothetical protein
VGLLDRRIAKNWSLALGLAPDEPVLANGAAQVTLGTELPQGWTLPVHVDALLLAVTPKALYLAFVETRRRDFTAVAFHDLFNPRLAFDSGAWFDADCWDGSEVHVRMADNPEARNALAFVAAVVDALASYDSRVDATVMTERAERRDAISRYRSQQAERADRLRQMSADNALDLFGRGWIKTGNADRLVEGSASLTPDGVGVHDPSGRGLVASFGAITSVTLTSASDELVTKHAYVFENGDPGIIRVLTTDGDEVVIHPHHPSQAENWVAHIEQWSH